MTALLLLLSHHRVGKGKGEGEGEVRVSELMCDGSDNNATITLS